MPQVPRLALVSLIVIAAIVNTGTRGRLARMPNRMLQVPQWWVKRYGLERSYLRYGLALGSAFFSYVPNPVIYGLFVGSSVLLELPEVALTGLAFGFGRTALVGPIALGTRWVGNLQERLALLSRSASLGSLGVAGVLTYILVREIAASLS
jgi:hypothetical protein